MLYKNANYCNTDIAVFL